MKRTRTVAAPPPAPQPEVVVHGRTLEPGTEVSIRGERGRFRYMRATTTSAGRLVLDFIGGPAGHEAWRSFYPERIRTVHRINKTRRNAA
ncbi:hypothetical protein SEA_BOOSTSEASON_78 [Mycobacterium phage BoostSeason]|uniref:DUF7246 domain-containing protein n=1 Tax=Mycobacterium phage Mufasa TaxID=1718600 RepID=A0A0M4RA44_9CAUD|nr:hypothetical protein SEA_MUFASA_78 [Mycobacterium phage Mufasa]ALF00512.1 hypothetical protein SEA_MUFASA_78 [Mycobacterium phage Mufasa]AYN57251.1 hypothetical protein SEA_BOOSTSEASON_78 [Mycobacterium phage BoostSeason]